MDTLTAQLVVVVVVIAVLWLMEKRMSSCETMEKHKRVGWENKKKVKGTHSLAHQLKLVGLYGNIKIIQTN